MIANTLVQVLKNQVPRKDEINDFKEVMKTQPLAKDPRKPHPNQAVPISIERHAMTFNEDLK